MGELPAPFGKYFLTDKIATGGMAEIYLAKLLGPGGFEKQLVIKQIHPRLSGQRHFVELFVTEAKTLVALTHGNIVPVYELGVVDRTYFIAMEYIDGPTLHRLGEAMADADATADPSIVAYLGCELLKGLDYAHRKGDGVIHRDLSPRNVMISRDGEVKLVDFGIAVAAQATAPDTDESEPVGSFPYMSPEQVRREPLGPASDLFSCSVLLWELLTGEALFARATPEATLEAVLTAAIPAPSSKNPAVPPRLEELVLRGLERDRSRRWSNAAEYLAALSRFLYAQDPLPTPVDVSRLVARHCPPTVSRAPVGGVTDVGAGAPAAAPAGIDRTKPVERPTPLTPARGKARAGTERSFATNVAFEQVLAKATPLFPFRALTDDEAMAALLGQRGGARHDGMPATAPPPALAAATPSSGISDKPGTAELPARAIESGAAMPASRRRRSAGLAAAAALVLVIAAAALAWPRATRGPNAGAARDTGAVGSAHRDAGTVVAADASLAIVSGKAIDAGAAAETDAGHPPPRRSDAGVRAAGPDTGVPAARTAQLKVGANPWGQVSVDGRALGRAPGQWPIAPGHHVVVVTFPVADHEQSERFEIDARPGAIEKVFADFTD